MILWLTSLIYNDGPITLREINARWSNLPMEDGMPFERNTFRKYIRISENIFNINIEYGKNGYYVENPRPLMERNLLTNMLADMQNMQFLSQYKNLGAAIQTEEIPEGIMYLPIVGDALTNNFRLKIEYQKFNDEPAYEAVVAPYCLKAIKRRWYLVGIKNNESQIKTFALDRILRMKTLKETFVPDESIDIERYFDHSYGIVVDESKVENVVIRTTELQAKYFRTLPLHPSQKEYPSCTFHYRVAVTLEFINEILRLNTNLEVLEPQSLRDILRERIEEMAKIYK